MQPSDPEITHPLPCLLRHVQSVVVCTKPIVWVLGGPGCGKGTQCEKIVEKYGFCCLSTGDLLRAEIKSGSEKAHELEALIEEGELVPNDIILELLSKEMTARADDATGFLIDGYPREEDQGRAFERVIGPVTMILYFAASAETLTRRLKCRALKSGRTDDNEKTIKHRLEIFFENDHKVIDQYPEKVCKIDAERDEKMVFAEVQKALDTLMAEHTTTVSMAT